MISLLIALSFIQPASPASAQGSVVCFILPDKVSHNVSGQVNSYWPGTANAAAGATSITLGARTGAAVNITYGDLLLVIQMQGAGISYANDNTYGSGVGGDGGSGYLTTNLYAGYYEYVVAHNTTAFTGNGSLTIAGKGTGGGLMNAYVNSNSTTTQGQQRFQVVRVPAYLDVTLTGNVTAAAWNGTTGGIIALEVVNIISLGGNTLNVDGFGFRGGGGRVLDGYNSPDTDYRTRSTRNANASKGEGLAGTPRYIYFNSALVDTNPTADGYPSGATSGGSYARGAPGNAGGGGTDGNPTDNDENSGGGGGGNGGTGGLGGNTWSSNLDRGGRNGAAFAQQSASRLVMGGGGGAGTTNNGTGNPALDGLYSSGAAGGGLVFLRIGGISGNGTITANGSSSLNVLNDSTGGGGAGGSVLVIANGTASLSGLSIYAQGGTAGNAWPAQPLGNNGINRHGPGGGGGGGVVYTSSTPTTISVAYGQHGTTTVAAEAYGSTNGAVGVTGTSDISAVPGAEAGFECFTPTSIGITQFKVTPGSLPSWPLIASVGVLAACGSGIWLSRRKVGRQKSSPQA